jgi:hypothetical protein
MILNSAFIEHRKFDGVEVESTKEFIEKLLAAKDLVADVYVNGARVCSGMLKVMLNNNWLIGCVDERLSITNMNDPATNLHILVHQLGYDNVPDDIILSVESPLDTFLEPGDIDSDLYFSIISTVPNCTQRCFVPESVFRNLKTSNITPKDFKDKGQCPTDPTIQPDDPGVIEELFKTNVTYACDANDQEHPVVFGVDFDVPEDIKNNIISNFGKYGMYLQIDGEQGDYTFDVSGNLIQDMAHINVHADGVSDISNVVMAVYPQNGGEQIGTATAVLRELRGEESYPKVTEKGWYVDAKALGILDLQPTGQN